MFQGDSHLAACPSTPPTETSQYFHLKAVTSMRRRPDQDISRRRALRTNFVLGSLVLLGGPFSSTASALRCFSCHACSAGGVLSARMQQCPPTEKFCAAVYRPRVGPTGSSSMSVDRGCASSIDALCLSDGTAVIENEEDYTYAKENDGNDKENSRLPTSSSQFPPPRPPSTAAVTAAPPAQKHCCSTDLCNGSIMRWEGDATWTLETEGYRRSAEHRRDLMEGTRSGSGSGRKESAHGERPLESGEQGVGNNSAPREGGGSRLATVLVIVGTFAQALWLAGSFLQ